MPPSVRVTDQHACPAVTGVVPHIGGPILPPGVPTVLIGGLPAATMGSLVFCTSGPAIILMGSPTVWIGGKPAARLGDPTAHGGAVIGPGCPMVIIGP